MATYMCVHLWENAVCFPRTINLYIHIGNDFKDTAVQIFSLALSIPTFSSKQAYEMMWRSNISVNAHISISKLLIILEKVPYEVIKHSWEHGIFENWRFINIYASLNTSNCTVKLHEFPIRSKNHFHIVGIFFFIHKNALGLFVYFIKKG